jgi:hypothetical protein
MIRTGHISGNPSWSENVGRFVGIKRPRRRDNMRHLRQKMDLRIDIELRGRILLVTASGNLTFDAALRLLKQVCDTAKEKEVNKILVNSLAVDGELSTFERYSLGVEVAAYLKQRQMNPRLAFVGKLPTTDGFAVRVGQNRGVTTESVFEPARSAELARQVARLSRYVLLTNRFPKITASTAASSSLPARVFTT